MPQGRRLLAQESMQRIIVLLSIVAQCGAFSTIGRVSSGGSCIDEPDEVIAEEAAKLGAEYAEFKTCAAIYEAGGCERADAKEACCATCSLPARMTYGGSVGLWGACGTGMYGSSPSDNCAKPNHCQVSCTEARCCEGPGHWGEFKKRYCKRYVCLAIERTVQSQQECLAADFNWASDDEFYWCENERYCRDC